MPEMNMLEAIRTGLDQAMAADERIFLIGEDIGVRGGVFRVTEGLQQKYGELRVIDSPLAESGIVGAAIGAALYGQRPIAEIQFADFIFPAIDQIISEAARIRYRSNGDWGVPLVIRAPWGGGIHGALYHSQSVEAFFTHVPGLKVVAPATPYDARGLLASAIADPDPVLFFEHKKLYRMIKGNVPEQGYSIPLGAADVKRRGEHMTVLAYGLMLHYALEAAQVLAEDGVEVEVVDLRTLRPLDTATILTSVKKTGKVLIIYEDNRFMGYGAELAALIAEEAFEYLDGPITRIAGLEVPAMPFSPLLEEAFLPNPERIAEAMRELARY